MVLATMLFVIFALASLAQLVVGKLIDRYPLKNIYLPIVLLQVPLGVTGDDGVPEPRTVAIAAAAVDWARTDAYREALRRAPPVWRRTGARTRSQRCRPRCETAPRRPG